MKTFSKLELRIYSIDNEFSEDEIKTYSVFQDLWRNIRHTKVKSSNLHSYAYSSLSKVLEVKFKSGAVYQYTGVPKHIWNALKAASSHGSYFYHNIRTSFPYRRVK